MKVHSPEMRVDIPSDTIEKIDADVKEWVRQTRGMILNPYGAEEVRRGIVAAIAKHLVTDEVISGEGSVTWMFRLAGQDFYFVKID